MELMRPSMITSKHWKQRNSSCQTSNNLSTKTLYWKTKDFLSFTFKILGRIIDLRTQQVIQNLILLRLWIKSLKMKMLSMILKMSSNQFLQDWNLTILLKSLNFVQVKINQKDKRKTNRTRKIMRKNWNNWHDDFECKIKSRRM